MDSYWESAMHSAGYTFDSGPMEIEPDWFQKLAEPVAILGKVYYPPIDHASLVLDIRSRMHCTYRHSFVPIGEPSGPTSDQGWGCMHRSGQMMLAHALMVVHLGRDWKWHFEEYNPIYARIEDLFHDVKAANYSIHQIASMGMAESRDIGKWFGPNTVAQVIRKLSLHDEWNKIVVHIAMEEGVIIDELKEKCQPSDSKAANPKDNSGEDLKSFVHLDSVPCCLVQHVVSDDCVEVLHMPTVATNITTNVATHSLPSPAQTENKTRHRFLRKSKESKKKKKTAQSLPATVRDQIVNEEISSQNSSSSVDDSSWKPLLLFIPLRLGLNRTNSQYIPALKKCLELRQSAGILGGWPRHALWIIGHCGDHLIYLDPHITQLSVTGSASDGSRSPSLTGLRSGNSTEMEVEEVSRPRYASSSATYHTVRPGRIHASQIDPSLAIGFICESEAAFDELCECLRREVLHPAAEPLFEIHDTRPAAFKMMMASNGDGNQMATYFSFPDADSDDEYEIIGNV